MQSLCTLTTSSDTFCTAVNEKRKHNGASGWSGQYGTVVGERRGQKKWGTGKKGGNKGGQEEKEMKRKGIKEKGLNFVTQGKERKITEYIDFFYSLHHLYKYIEPQKTNKKENLRKKTNSAIQKPTTAVRQTESKRGASCERVHERDRTAERGRRQNETWQEKRRAAGESRKSAQLCVWKCINMWD